MADGGKGRGGSGGGSNEGKSLAGVERQTKRIQSALEAQRREALASGDTARANALLRRKQAVGRMASATRRAINRANEERGLAGSRTAKVDRNVYTNGRMGRSRRGGIGQYRSNTQRQTNARISNIMEGARRLGLSQGNVSAKAYVQNRGMRDRNLKGKRKSTVVKGAQTALRVGIGNRFHSYYRPSVGSEANSASRAKANAANRRRLQRQAATRR